MEQKIAVFAPSKKTVLLLSATLLFVAVLKLNSIVKLNQTLINVHYTTNIFGHYTRQMSEVENSSIANHTNAIGQT